MGALGANEEPVHALQAAARSAVVRSTLSSNKSVEVDENCPSVKEERWEPDDDPEPHTAWIPQAWHTMAPNVRVVCCGAEHTVC